MDNRIFDFNTPITYIKSFLQEIGKGIGRIIILFLDVILGGVVLSRLLSNYTIFEGFGFEISGSILAWMFSFGFWYIQIMLWDKILRDGIDWNDDWFYITLAVIFAVGDTVIDSSVVQIWESQELHSILSGKYFFGIPINTYDLLMNFLLILVIILTGFGEYLDRTMNDTPSTPFRPNFRRSSPKNQRKPRKIKNAPPKSGFVSPKPNIQHNKSRSPENPRWLEGLSDKVPQELDIPTIWEKYKNV